MLIQKRTIKKELSKQQQQKKKRQTVNVETSVSFVNMFYDLKL